MMNSRNKWIGLLTLALLVAGCFSTTLTGSWKSPDYTGQVKKVYIIGIAKQEPTRRIFEDEFRKQFAA
jgi:hypothetical protein